MIGENAKRVVETRLDVTAMADAMEQILTRPARVA